MIDPARDFKVGDVVYTSIHKGLWAISSISGSLAVLVLREPTGRGKSFPTEQFRPDTISAPLVVMRHAEKIAE